jgi:hypothetical protein
VIVVNIQEYFPKVPRENVFVYWPQSHGIFVILFFNNKIINQNSKKLLISVSGHTKWDKQQEMSSSLNSSDNEH